MVRMVLNVDEKAKMTLELALQHSHENLDDVFERFIYGYAEKVLSEIRNGADGAASGRQGETDADTARADYAGNVCGQSTLQQEMPLKAMKRLPLWASRATTFIHQIISAYFAVEIDGEANLNKMYEKFSIENPHVSAFTFRNNIVALTSEKGNASGHLFELSNDRVKVYKPMADALNARRRDFIAEEN